MSGVFYQRSMEQLLPDPDADAGADDQGAQQNRAGVGDHSLTVRPNDLLQFAFHLAEPCSAVSLLLDFFCHTFTRPFSFRSPLLGFTVERVLSAEGAILVQLKTIGGILLVLHGVVVSLLALRAPKGDLDARACLCHLSAPPFGVAVPGNRFVWTAHERRLKKQNAGSGSLAGPSETNAKIASAQYGGLRRSASLCPSNAGGGHASNTVKMRTTKKPLSQV